MTDFEFAKIRIYDNLSELLKQIPKWKKDYFAYAFEKRAIFPFLIVK